MSILLFAAPVPPCADIIPDIVAAAALSDADIDAILRAEPPAEAAQYENKMTAVRDADS